MKSDAEAATLCSLVDGFMTVLSNGIVTETPARHTRACTRPKLITVPVNAACEGETLWSCTLNRTSAKPSASGVDSVGQINASLSTHARAGSPPLGSGVGPGDGVDGGEAGTGVGNVCGVFCARFDVGVGKIPLVVGRGYDGGSLVVSFTGTVAP